MMCYVNYISAVFRLKELQKSVTMLGGDDEAPEMVRAQRDFVKLEKEYFGEECVRMSYILLFGGIITFFGLAIWMKYYA